MEEQNLGGRPTKLNSVIIAKIKEVIEEDINAIILTDEELVMLANEKLDDFDKFSYSAFQDWKAHILGSKQKEDVVVPEENQKLYDKLGGVIKKALFQQKANLFAKMRDEDERSWQRYAWIIERKFSEWNMTRKNEVTGKDGSPLFSKVEVEIINKHETFEDDEYNIENQGDERTSEDNSPS